MKYNREMLIDRFNSGEIMEVIAFWGHTPDPIKMTKACFSQWYDCVFIVNDICYHTAEQFMMAQKALLFGDRETYGKIMESAEPRKYKALGRLVKDFNEGLWNRKKYEIVLQGNLAKFSQNPELWEFLDGTGNAVLVEGSPYDGIWGVHLSFDDPKIKDPNNWKGENLLGFALMEARDILRSSGQQTAGFDGNAENAAYGHR